MFEKIFFAILLWAIFLFSPLVVFKINRKKQTKYNQPIEDIQNCKFIMQDKMWMLSLTGIFTSAVLCIVVSSILQFFFMQVTQRYKVDFILLFMFVFYWFLAVLIMPMLSFVENKDNYFIFKKDCIECKLKGKIRIIPYEHLREAIKTRNYIILNLEDGKQYKFLCAEMKFYYEDLLLKKLQETSYTKKEKS